MEGHDFYLRFLMVQLLPSLMMIWLFMTYKWAVKEHSFLLSYQFIEFDIFSYVKLVNYVYIECQIGAIYLYS